ASVHGRRALRSNAGPVGSPGPPSRRTGSEAEDVAHGVEPGGLPHDPSRRPQRAPREALPALGAMHQLEALTETPEDDGVVSHGVAGAQRDDADLARPARPHESLAREHGRALDVLAAGRGPSASPRRPGAARRRPPQA